MPAANTKRPSRCAFATEALMVRALHKYRTFRDHAERVGADLSADPVVPSFEALSGRYDKLFSEWVSERPDTVSDAMVYLDLVAAIIDGERSEQRGDEGGAVLSTEFDFGYPR